MPLQEQGSSCKSAAIASAAGTKEVGAYSSRSRIDDYIHHPRFESMVVSPLVESMRSPR